MSDADFVEHVRDAAQVGLILGLLLGALIPLVVREIVVGIKDFRRDLERARQIRCMKTDWK